MKLDNDFKNEVDKAFAEGGYIIKKITLRFFAIFLLISTIVTIGTIFTKKVQTEVDRVVFKESTAYNESAANFLSDAYIQYTEAEADSNDSRAIMEYVRMRYPNLDSKSIENSTLRQFYNKCINGK